MAVEKVRTFNTRPIASVPPTIAVHSIRARVIVDGPNGKFESDATVNFVFHPSRRKCINGLTTCEAGHSDSRHSTGPQVIRRGIFWVFSEAGASPKYAG